MRQNDPIKLNEGWAVHVYDSDRRLLCSIHPFHIWIFVIGVIVGGLAVASWTRCEPAKLPAAGETPAKQAPLAVD